KGGLRYFPVRSIRERVLDCDVEIEAGLPRMKVAVRDLVALQPGCLLKLRTPVRTPGMLTVGGLAIFEAVPVRNGSKKAAQVGRRTRLTNSGME
ncbi:MAG: FliM/FliN family flagellar motor switch protein, partial [Acidobacteriota bacterium]|nr:FliM/FliN family flagellar motor switch protein [Acidobacteriota bacterium]